MKNGFEPEKEIWKNPETKNQEVFDFANKVMDLPDKKFKKRFIEALAKLDERDWECLEKIVLEITKEG